MTLQSRLAVGLVAIAIILVGPLAYAVESLAALQNDAKELRDQDFAGSLALGRLRDGLNGIHQQELAVLFSGTFEESRSALDQQIARVTSQADSLKRYGLTQYAGRISASIAQLSDAVAPEYTATRAGKPTTADSLSSYVFNPALARADSTIASAIRDLQTRTSGRVTDVAVAIVGTKRVTVAALVLALVLAAGISAWLTRSISAPIRDLKSGMSAVADGFLEYKLRMPNDRADEFGQLAVSFREMTRQLGELDKLKAEFVSVASHELKTPINVMIGYLQLLEDGVYGPLSGQQQEILKTVGNQANTLARLVKQLLDVSRFEAGGGRLEPRPIELDHFAGDLESAFRVLAMQREVHFQVDKHNGLPSEVFWDLDRINEVIGNLLSNAFKFTPRGGSVNLTLSPVGSDVRVTVRDTGAGIPPEQLPRIFEKFYMADNQSAARAAGSGLGLAIAKQIVEAHGGTITCESTVGVGTTFTITLPSSVVRRVSQRLPQVAVS